MLASITPLGERSRQQHWPLTVAAHLLGSTAGGAAIGVLLGTLGSAIGGTDTERSTALGVVILIGVLLDLQPLGLRLPTHRRQVDQRWLGRYRGWVYGIGFGAQLGTGIATVINSSAIYATLAGCLLAPTPAWGCVIGALFGFTRGATLLLTAGADNPARLLQLHRKLHRLAPLVAGVVLLTQSILALTLLGVPAA